VLANNKALARSLTHNRMTHIAITGTLNGKNVEWMEEVSDEQYNGK